MMAQWIWKTLKKLARGPWNNGGLDSYQHGISLIETDYVFYGDI